jgi:nucleoside-diphosphate-sugar epimerase
MPNWNSSRLAPPPDGLLERKENPMKIFVAGGSGAIGRRLVPLLTAVGYEVVASTRSNQNARMLYDLGAEPVVLNALDRDAVIATVTRVEPEMIVHQLTSLAEGAKLRRFDRVFAATNRLRTEGTDNLLAAARVAGTRRTIAQSFGNWNYERSGSSIKTETDPLDPTPPRSMRRTLAAIAYLEAAVVEAGGLALRYGNIYGPGTATAEDGALVEFVRQNRLPIFGDGAGVWSFVHVDDAALATLAAIERGAPGVYNVTDDEPAPANVWLPELASILGAKPPGHIPAWLGRLAVGEVLVSMFTRIRGASNAKAKRDLGWELLYPTWRRGFRTGLGVRPVELPAYSPSAKPSRQVA